MSKQYRQEQEARIKQIEKNIAKEREAEKKAQEETRQARRKLTGILNQINASKDELQSLLTQLSNTLEAKTVAEQDVVKMMVKADQLENNIKVKKQELADLDKANTEKYRQQANAINKRIEVAEQAEKRAKEEQDKVKIDDAKREERIEELERLNKNNADGLNKLAEFRSKITIEKGELDEKISKSKKLIDQYEQLKKANTAISDKFVAREKKIKLDDVRIKELESFQKEKEIALNLREGMLVKRERKVDMLVETNNLDI